METRSKIQVSGFWAVLGALALSSTMGCELITTVDRHKIAGGGGSGGSTTTTGGGMGGGDVTSSTGGMGGMPQCALATDCPKTGNECLAPSCTADGQCVPSPVMDGTAVAKQAPGDCQMVVCDGAGATKSINDDTDLPNDGKECTTDTCVAGAKVSTPVAANTACGANKTLYCDAGGSCVGCNDAAQCGMTTDCATPTCTTGTCGTSFAVPGTAVPAQTAGDCMQVQCDGLGGHKAVVDDTDIVDDGKQCTEDVCVAGMATHPNSSSGKACTENGGARCNGGGACVECLLGPDCASLVCMNQSCVAATCMDAVQNGNETGTDCGGADCAPCAPGGGCLVGADCTSLVCSGSPLLCQAPACNDTVKNGTETDVDCGGMCMTKCGPTKACLHDADCVGGSCMGNTCVPTCTDMVKDGTETDVDCGGSCATKCAGNKMCGLNADCASGACLGGVCGVSCTDMVKDGTETDVDCGGSCATKCASGQMCGGDGDCSAGLLCITGVCAPPPTDIEPANNMCVGATPETLPANIMGLHLPTNTDVDWFVFMATAADVGKLVHVATPTPDMCDSVVEVFAGADCATQTTLGGPSDDSNYGEDWLSAPIQAAGPFWVKVSYTQAFPFAGMNYTLQVTLQPNPDIEPTNNTCLGATPETAPANITGLHLQDNSDEDWFVFTATAADVGKMVHVVTPTPDMCDSVVEVFAGADCATQVSLGGPSDDMTYAEDWLSTPITAAGQYWVHVSYSSFGFAGTHYTLQVTLQ